MDNTKLNKLGIIFSYDESDNIPQIQRIDNVEDFKQENDIEYYIPQLRDDLQARQLLEDLVIDNYIEKIKQDLHYGDEELLYNIVSGKGIIAISHFTDDELFYEAKELSII